MILFVAPLSLIFRDIGAIEITIRLIIIIIIIRPHTCEVNVILLKSSKYLSMTNFFAKG